MRTEPTDGPLAVAWAVCGAVSMVGSSNTVRNAFSNVITQMG